MEVMRERANIIGGGFVEFDTPDLSETEIHTLIFRDGEDWSLTAQQLTMPGARYEGKLVKSVKASPPLSELIELEVEVYVR